jgi:hypothetical protein
LGLDEGFDLSPERIAPFEFDTILNSNQQ